MNKDTIKGEWRAIKGKIKEKWGKLTDDDLTQINGKREQLLGTLQKKYGYAKEHAEKELSAWERTFEETSPNRPHAGSFGSPASPREEYNRHNPDIQGQRRPQDQQRVAEAGPGRKQPPFASRPEENE